MRIYCTKIGKYQNRFNLSNRKKEIEIGESWLRIRNQKTCCDCLYQYICPSPSDLDLMIGQLNLCTVNNK